MLSRRRHPAIASADWVLGKILKDDDTVESYKIEEKGFVVCMVNKVCTPETLPGFANADNHTAQGTQASPRRVLFCSRRPRDSGPARRRYPGCSSRAGRSRCCARGRSLHADARCSLYRWW